MKQNTKQTSGIVQKTNQTYIRHEGPTLVKIIKSDEKNKQVNTDLTRRLISNTRHYTEDSNVLNTVCG